MCSTGASLRVRLSPLARKSASNFVLEGALSYLLYGASTVYFWDNAAFSEAEDVPTVHASFTSILLLYQYVVVYTFI